MKIFKKGKNEKKFDEVISQILKEHDEAVEALKVNINIIDEEGNKTSIEDLTSKAKQLITEHSAWMEGYKVGTMTGAGAGVIATIIGATILGKLKK